MQDLESAAPRGSPQRRRTVSKGEVELAVVREFALWQHGQRSMQFDKSSDDPHPRRRIRLKDLAEYYFRSLKLQLGMLALSVFSCFLFIFETYQPNGGLDSLPVTVIEVIISSAFLIDFVLSVAFSLDRWAYLWSVNGLVDFLSVLPMLPFIAYRIPGSTMDSRAESGFHWIESTNLCRVLRAVKVFRVMRLSTANSMSAKRHRTLGLVDVDSVHSRIFKLVFWLGGIIFMATGVMWYLQRYGGNHYSGPEGTTFSWFTCFYYLTTTFSTVGYGDITPRSQVARMFTVICILFFLAFIPFHIGKLVEAFVSQSGYTTASFRHVSNAEHIVIAGHVNYGVITRFVSHFLHGDHVFEHHFRLVVLSTEPPDAWVQTVLNHPRYHDRVQWLQGAPWNPEDLHRAGASAAKAVFILADLDTHDMAKDQDRILLTAVSVRKHLIRSSVGPIHERLGQDEDDERFDRFAEEGEDELGGPPVPRDPLRMLQHSISFYLRRGGGQDSSVATTELTIDEEASARVVVQAHTSVQMEELIHGQGFRKTYCPHIIRLRLMAYATVYPGLVAFFNYLVRTDPIQADEAVAGTRWFSDVKRGAQHRLVRCRIEVPEGCPLRDKTFAEAARYLYRNHHVVLLGLEIHGVFLMNPHRRFHFRQSPPSVALYVIALSGKDAKEALHALTRAKPEDFKVMTPVHLTAHDLDPPRFRYIAEPAIRRLFSPLRARTPAASAPPDPSNLHSQTFQDDGGDPPTHPPSGDVQGLLDTSSKLIAEASHGTEAERKHKLLAARELLDRALSSPHLQLPDRLSKHVVIGLCSMDTRTMGWLLQYISALRRLVHLPIVILGTDVERFHSTARRLQTRLVPPPHRHPVLGDHGCMRLPSHADIYMVEGSPQSKADLQRCRVQHAHAVILLGEGAVDKDDVHDPVLSDRPVLLASFSLESVLRCGPERHVLTIADLRSDNNANLLRQRYRSSQGPADSVLFVPTLRRDVAGGSLNAYLGRPPHAHSTLPSLHSVQASLPRMLQGPSVSSSRSSFSAHPVLAAGKACCRNFFDSLLVSLYQQPTTLRFWREVFRSVHDDMHSGDFMWGGSVGYEPKDAESGFHVLAGGKEGADRDLQSTVDEMRSCLDMVYVPSDYIGRTYMELVDALMANDIVTLGLYRKHGTDDAPLPYAVVNPPAKTVMNRRDQLYILRPWCAKPRSGPSADGGLDGSRGLGRTDEPPVIRRSASSVT